MFFWIQTKEISSNVYIMAQLIQELSKDNDSSLISTTFFVIRTVMNSQNSTFQLKTEERKTLLFRQQSLFEGFSADWKFTAISQDCILIQLMPQFLHTFGAPLKIANQRMLVDLLRVFTLKNIVGLWKVIVKQTSEIVLQYMPKANQVLKSFPANLSFLKIEGRSILNRLLIILQPYSFQTFPINPSESKNDQSGNSLSEEVFSAFVMLQSRKLIREALEQTESKLAYIQAKNIQMRREQVFQTLKKYREKAFNQVSQIIKISGNKNCFIQNISQEKLKRCELKFKIWQQSFKNQWKGDYKNVFGVKILNQIQNQGKRKAEGTHCQVMMGRFQIVVMASLNSSTNIAFQRIAGGESLKYQKQLELVKKKCKNKQRQPSLNSFYNQLDFIEYIKDRNCRNISTYYWQIDKKKVEMEDIIMDFYPHTLLSTTYSINCKISLHTLLNILLQIAEALAWLADNLVCHRDIKPENIMLSSEGIPKIVDFGSCCPSFRGGNKQSFSVKDQRLLATPKYSKKYKEIPQELKTKYTKRSYQEHMLYDAFSFGKVMQQIFQDILGKNLRIGNIFLQYLYKRCLQVVPQNRPTYQQIGFVLFELLKHLETHIQSF